MKAIQSVSFLSSCRVSKWIPRPTFFICAAALLLVWMTAINVDAQTRAEQMQQRQNAQARAEYLNRHLGEMPYSLTRGETIVVDESDDKTNAEEPSFGGILQPKWNQLAGPEAATILALHESNGRILAGTLAGIYYSDDQGLTWQRSGGSPIRYTSFRFVTLGDAIFVGIDKFSSNDGPAGGVLRSLDNGLTWEHITTGLSEAPWILSLEKWQDNTLLASTSGGLVFRSTDSGASWQAAMNGLPNELRYFFFIGSSQAIIAVTAKGLFRSLDGGAQWEDINANLPAGTELVPGQFPIAFGESFVVWAGAGGVLISDDNGTSWRAINNGFPAEAFVGDVALFGATLYATLGDGSAYISSDRGANWKKQSEGFALGKGLRSSLTVGNTYFFGTSDGVYRSEDNGQTWQRSMSGMRASYVNGGILSVGNRLLAAAEGGVWASDNKGASWRLLDNGFRHYPLTDLTAAGLAVKDGILYAGVFGDGLYRSTDGGNTFERLENGLPARWATVVIKVFNGKIYVGDYFGGAYVSSDDGATWTAIKGLTEGYSLFSMGNLGGGRLLMGGYPGKVFRSDDNGETWREFHTGIGIDFVSDFITVANSCLVATDDGVYRLNDDETGWTKVTSYQQVSDHSNGFGRQGKAIYSCSFGYGITVSYDNGATWGKFNNGMSVMRGFFFTEMAGDLYFGSGGASMWVLRANAKTTPPPPPPDPE